ncbi:triose-phosphate isomerase [Salinisphaera hydrothermalis]|uniref:Triosephosphate isomerase n=1 Tax=Salinisphaera hydrothermalis (strain C41B8) TaxID=1304275 RepID=A0A084IJU5_SALHC|nr:triose-phosphate isomerase [Salinisphaera hydrothermalis]KEZ76979.1 triosephosphate isomerase [Salinisphaera hydrothermalis C41B8]
MTRRKFIAGNWKMNGSVGQVDAFGRALVEAAPSLDCDLAVCVPFVYVERLARALESTHVAAGAQDLSSEVDPGAFTGEINGSMLAECGARYVVVGHSERREMFGETDDIVVAKAEAAIAAGLTPIVCIGESLEQREADETENVLARQIGALTRGCERRTLEAMVLAYEPIWAIGTGRSATPEQAQSVHAFVRSQIANWDATIADSLPILYGGSVKPDNASALFAGADVDGALVGGASLKADSFVDIARAVI